MGIEGFSNQPGSNKKSRVETLRASVLAGALLAQPPAMAEEMEVDPLTDEVTANQIDTGEYPPGPQSILFSEYEKGKRLPMDYGDVQREFEKIKLSEQEARRNALANVTPEKRAQGDLDAMKERIGFTEALGRTREGLSRVIDVIAEKTGETPSLVIEAAGDLVVSSAVEKINSKFNEALVRAMMKGMTAEEQSTWKFINDSRYTGNMSFVRTLAEGGGQDGVWRLEVGADPGIEMGDELNPRMGITFRMSTP